MARARWYSGQVRPSRTEELTERVIIVTGCLGVFSKVSEMVSPGDQPTRGT